MDLPFTVERITSVNNSDLVTSSIERYEFANKFIKDQDIVCDFACGTGYGTEILAKKAKKVIGLDIDAETIQYCKKAYKNKGIDFNLIEPNEISNKYKHKFDVIVSYETIEHIEAYEHFLKMLHFYLKPKGILVLSTPNNFRHKFDSQNPFHIYEFDIEELYTVIQKKYLNARISLYGQHRMIFKKNDVLPKNSIAISIFKKMLHNMYELDKGLFNIGSKLEHTRLYKSIGRLQKDEPFDASIYDIQLDQNYIVPRTSIYVVYK